MNGGLRLNEHERVAARTVAVMRIRRAATLVLVALSVSACAIAGESLGGRVQCWPEVPQRIPSLMKGVLTFGLEGPSLATPEGDELPLLLNRFDLADVGSALALSDPGGGGIVAAEGDTVTLFGGLGADGSMYVCDVEERGG